ncbi:pentapeptide repeat-containing protein [Roseibium sp. RKSG952]|uniref:pentapeptide repeat-containing protein n=1 Tax=Roseibium sp. RKSG952 TaxID=2529384 RepID=UPI0012BD000E|nr:pentapeptide repeat-containing protein [Roseibium sp. RKSG952]MTH95086.1 pentapeptide repeat-containing protein [Roseibium sp. RKSG952]
MKNWIIKDIEGNELHSGEASTKRELIVRLVNAGVSMAGADLSGQRLWHCDLSGGDFRGANLSGADLRGTIAEKANFSGAIMRGVKASGFKSTRSDFSNADLSRLNSERSNRRTSMEGAILSYSRFNGATLNGADFSDAAMSAASFVGANMRSARFRDANLKNADWTGATVISCDFHEANLTPTYKIAENHLPDRTRLAVVSGNNLKKTKIGPGNMPFRIDRMTGKLVKNAAAAAATTGIFYLGNAFSLDPDIDALKAYIGTGAGLVAAVAAVNFLKEKIEDTIKDGALAWLAKSQVAVRCAVAKFVRRGCAVGDLAIAFATNREARRILKHMNKNADGGVLHAVSGMISGTLKVIVCDRKKLSDALVALSAFKEERMRGEGDVILMRLGKHDTELPKAVLLDNEGKSAAIWDFKEHGGASVVWNEDGKILEAVGDRRNASRWMNRDQVLGSFQRAVLFDTDTPDFEYDPDTHGVRQGRDGSLVVIKTSNGRIDNPHGPAVLTPKNERLWFKDAKQVTETGEPYEHSDEEPGGFGIPGLR